MIAALAACGGQTSDPAGQAAPPAAPAEAAAPAEPAAPAAAPLEEIIAGSWRAESAARDAYRHPKETLEFFGIRPDMTVIEITPGGGWYAEILAPWLAPQGRYVGAIIDPSSASSEGARDYYSRSNEQLRSKFGAAPDQFGKTQLIEFDSNAPSLGAAGTADAVLTFRNVHNWMNNGSAPGMFGAFFAVLKPGGVLGVVEHRANADVPAGDRSGYMSEAQVIKLATDAGFVLEEKSEINANPLDTKDHPNGVWTLPPSNRHDEADAAKYQAIGESDRMTLRFRKPA
ncbi:class I SAM-dependent methyltransferase [Pseudomarimonas salicorniae]|uniref:class I SAM-dependent methyltransferase n=1 Tax=Pseudomarimonas salicorniae TaxID=2933270 RepID=UPI003CCC94C2